MASKKAAKKKAAKAPRNGARYELTAKGKTQLDEMGPQQKLVAQAISNKALSSAEIGNAISSKLETKQPASRVAGFYISQMKHDGLVKKVAAA